MFKMTINGVALSILISCLLSPGLALPAGETCGTEHPSHAVTSNRAIPTCGLHECDDPTVRDLYLLNSESPTINIRMNLLYFGDLSGSNETNYDAQLAFFQSEYARLMNITWNINTTVITNRYQSVTGSLSNRTEHEQMALEYYVPGSMTVLLSRFNPNLDSISGYAFVPQAMNFDTAPAKWYAILNLPSAMTPQSTVMLHEVGHMLGLFHTFTEACMPCSENVNSENLDLVGDFCSDTKPVWKSTACDVLTRSYDCNSQSYADVSQLPQDNYMAYTPDSCKDTFTPQQTARARCYLDRLIDFVVTSEPGAPSNAPITDAPISQTPGPSSPSSDSPVYSKEPISGETPASITPPESSDSPSSLRPSSKLVSAALLQKTALTMSCLLTLASLL